MHHRPTYNRKNTMEGKCCKCFQIVKIGEGIMENRFSTDHRHLVGRVRIKHFNCPPVPQPKEK